MADPFQDLSTVDDATLKVIIESLERRAADPQMVSIIDGYLNRLSVPEAATILDIGSGTGAITRRIAERYIDVAVKGVEPAAKLVTEARRRAKELSNLTFLDGDGTRLELADETVNVSIFHTVLSHVPDPGTLIDEAVRVTRPGGQVVICDADWSKLTLASCEGDPLDACAAIFRRHFVTDPHLTSKLRPLATYAGLEVDVFEITNRLDFGGGGGLSWVELSGKYLADSGIIGRELADALRAEYERRASSGTLYGFLPFVTLIARKEGR
ncbi:MAG: methyltransferase domain-containing protein [Pseudomonadota bacterium]